METREVRNGVHLFDSKLQKEFRTFKMTSLSQSTPMASLHKKSRSVSNFSSVNDSGYADSLADSTLSTASLVSSCDPMDEHLEQLDESLFVENLSSDHKEFMPTSYNSKICKFDAGCKSVYPINEADVFLSPEPNSFSCHHEFSDIVSSNLSIAPSDLTNKFNEVLQKFSPKEPDRLIGRKMGLEHVDVISEMNSRNISCLSLVLSHLEPEDLCRMCMVSKDWKSVCEENRKANDRRKKFLHYHNSFRVDKENFKEKPPESIRRSLTTGSRLSTVQYVVNSRYRKPDECMLVKKDLFSEAAKCLKNEEKLQHCPQCYNVSKILPVQERGKCQNPECNFDYCIKCLQEFHGVRTCIPIVSKRTKTDTVGSKKSKKNLKRL